MKHDPNKIKLSLRNANLQSQVSASYALMAVLPILGLWYLIWAYVDPEVLSQQNTVLILFVIIAISVFGFMVLRGVVRALSDFREHLKTIVDDRALDTPLTSEEPSETPPKESIEEIVYTLIKHNSSLSDMFSEMEDMACSKSREVTQLNLEMQRQAEEHKAAEAALRKSNMQLSDALEKLKKLQQCMIRHERLSALGELASGIAHDINNALMPVIGFAELILEDASLADDKTALLKMVSDILNGARDAAEVVTKLRSFYRRDASLNFTEIDPESITKEVVELTSPRWKELHEAKGTRIQLKSSTSGAPRFMGDSSRIKDALVSIVMNSIDALPDGGDINLEIKTDGDYALITVQDNGVGMSKQTQERCMEPFFTTKGHDATGMGLATAYGIVRSHSGTIEAESAEGKGTTIKVRIPIEIPEGKDMPSHKQDSPPRLDPLTILVIDDDEGARESLKRMFKPGNHDVTTTPTGKAGVSLALEKDFDVIITDRAMPDISGDEVAATIHAQKPDLPILMLTGFGDLMIEQNEKPEGVMQVIPKPVDGKTLQWALLEAVKPTDKTGAID